MTPILRLLPAIALLAFAAPPLQAAVPSAGKWKGLLGPSGSPLPTAGTAFPADSWAGLSGMLDLAVTKPSKSAPAGRFTFTLSAVQGNATLRLRGRGSLQSDGRLQWSGSVDRTVSASLLFEPPASPEAALRGTVTLAEQTFPVLAYREAYTRTSPLPASEAGLHTLFATGLGGFQGTAIGSATLATAGTARLAAILPDGTKLSGSSALVSEDSGPFLPVFLLAKGKAPLGAWAFKIASPEADWTGGAALPGTAPVDLQLVRHPKPGKSEPVVPWLSADLFMEHPSFLFSTGIVTRGIDNKLAFTFSPGQFVRTGRFAFNPATGSLSATILYSSLTDLSGSDKPASATIQGLLNRKTGAILGFVLPKTSGAAPGLFDILPVAP